MLTAEVFMWQDGHLRRVHPFFFVVNPDLANHQGAQLTIAEIRMSMRDVDPSARLIAVGSVGKWSIQMLTDCAEHMDLISEHLYLQDKEAVPEHVAQMPDRIRRIVNAHRGYRTKLD